MRVVNLGWVVCGCTSLPLLDVADVACGEIRAREAGSEFGDEPHGFHGVQVLVDERQLLAVVFAKMRDQVRRQGCVVVLVVRRDPPAVWAVSPDAEGVPAVRLARRPVDLAVRTWGALPRTRARQIEVSRPTRADEEARLLGPRRAKRQDLRVLHRGEPRFAREREIFHVRPLYRVHRGVQEHATASSHNGIVNFKRDFKVKNTGLEN